MRTWSILVVACVLLSGCASKDEAPQRVDEGKTSLEQPAQQTAAEAEPQPRYYNVTLDGVYFPSLLTVPKAGPASPSMSGTVMTVEQDGVFKQGHGRLDCQSDADAVFEWRLVLRRGDTFEVYAEHAGPSPITVDAFEDVRYDDEFLVFAHSDVDAGAHVEVSCDIEFRSIWERA